MNNRTLLEITDEIESLRNKLELLEREKKIIKFCEKCNIPKKELKQIQNLDVITTNEYNSEGEYSHLHKVLLKINFQVKGQQRSFKVLYHSYSPNDDGDRYATGYNVEYDGDENEIICHHLYKIIDEMFSDSDYDEIRNFILDIHE